MAINKYQKRRKLLVDALLSGKYKQGKEFLASKDKGKRVYCYCVLGVACEVYNKNVPEEQRVKVCFHNHTNVFRTKSYGGQQATLPNVVREYFGFKNWNGFKHGGLILMALNDQGVSFAELVKIMKLNPEGLWEKGTY